MNTPEIDHAAYMAEELDDIRERYENAVREAFPVGAIVYRQHGPYRIQGKVTRASSFDDRFKITNLRTGKSVWVTGRDLLRVNRSID